MLGPTATSIESTVAAEFWDQPREVRQVAMGSSHPGERGNGDRLTWPSIWTASVAHPGRLARVSAAINRSSVAKRGSLLRQVCTAVMPALYALQAKSTCIKMKPLTRML